ncbi:uncharacterized protein LOC109822289 isoform X2 [Asparagus officinalis]|uniref:uncharacterized protein LOC109822289 isoform X2 n=1 Tax=Asparagus officinalis TaxID=4686 RepID=UPI00098DF6E8|nr:uncharacterized protein LOC109822289 isoform X2 [Asparagus officinalis]
MFYAPGFFDEGELPSGPVSPGSDNMDCFMQQMCDALHDGSLGIDLNIDLEQVNSVEPTVPYSDVAMERPAEDEAYHDVGFKERGCAPVPSFSKPDAGLLADMLAEQTTRGTVKPYFGSDSFIGIYLISFILPDLLSD